ncbi:winged helix-turn-helix transcriptional regulator [Bacillus sp. B-jedd]|uniref:winged helix-turn-helix transcriptional regulator n=1 Tax=Bacillus sp. B-jedd TaxID=1476857 RepID=UPI0005155AE3|nr:helix-turn-helix domain-containing protein [Bacillus sp. B-jedd]CEG27029.1 transcriptional regulator [Bacillus sp. B-jedd]
MEKFELCPRVEKAMQLIGKRWTGLILYQLMYGPQRFSEMESILPVSARVLTERLKELEEEGLVSRKAIPGMPVRVEYSLTEKGKSLTPAIKELARWAQDWMPNDEPAR